MTRCVTVFDLDKTLPHRDSYLSYPAGFLLRYPWRILRCLPLPWAVLRYAVGRLDNTALKQRFLHAILGDARKQDVNAWTAVFVDRLLARGLCRQGVQVLERHRQRGDLLVLLTASFDLYVEEVGRRLGFHHIACTKAEWVGERLSGNLAGPNHRGSEKVEWLLRFKQAHPDGVIIAYADHHSDIALLELADR